MAEAAELAASELGVECELIELRTLLPWDQATVAASVERTGRLLVSHEAPRTGGLGAEICAQMQEQCFLRLEAPPGKRIAFCFALASGALLYGLSHHSTQTARVTGYDTPFPLVFEKLYVPDKLKIFAAIKDLVNY